VIIFFISFLIFNLILLLISIIDLNSSYHNLLFDSFLSFLNLINNFYIEALFIMVIILLLDLSISFILLICVNLANIYFLTNYNLLLILLAYFDLFVELIIKVIVVSFGLLMAHNLF
jgi:hypothetical protein